MSSKKINLKALVLITGLMLAIFCEGVIANDIESGFPTHSASGEPVISYDSSSYPADPNADISWLLSCGFSGVASLQCAFNHARTTENNQLDTLLPMLTLPSQEEWDSMSDGEKALWLINRERIDRDSIFPLDDIESNVTGVAQTYAQYLLDNDTWGHEEDGRTPWERLADNPMIGACYDFLPVAENIALFVSTGTIPIPVERSVYMWMYEDAGAGWGHRHAILWYPYNDNSCDLAIEGFLGIGRASGGPYQGPFNDPWPFAEIIVMNVFDPCSTWACAYDECLADINCDGKVNLADLVIMKGEYLQPCPPSPCSGDCNSDGKVNLSDLVIMKTEYLRSDCLQCPQ